MARIMDGSAFQTSCETKYIVQSSRSRAEFEK